MTWQIPGEPPPPHGAPPIAGAYLAALVYPAGATLQIIQQPTNVVALLPMSGGGPRSLLADDFSANGGGFTTRIAGNTSGGWVYDPANGAWRADGSGDLPSSEKTPTSPRLTVTPA